MAATGVSPWPSLQVSDVVKDEKTGAVGAILNFQQQHVHLVSTRRDGSGTDGAIEGAAWEQEQVFVMDGRNCGLTLDANGFELTMDPDGADGIEFMDNRDVISRYYAQCERLVRTALNADDSAVIRAFDHNIRSHELNAAGVGLKGGSLVQQPAGIVHADFTKDSAPRRLQQLGEPPKTNDTLKAILGDTPLIDPALVAAALSGEKRLVFLNVWRNIDREQPVFGTPLACCDAGSTCPASLLTFKIHYADRVGENYFVKYHSGQRWYYFPRMHHGEALLLKQWDSAGGLAHGCEEDARDGRPSTFAIHSAMREPDLPPGAPDRKSIEVRLVAIL
jgi:hypothetical protein